MRIALYNYREEAKRIIDSKLVKEQGYVIDCIYDADARLWGQEYNGVRVVSPFETIKRYKDKRIEKIVLPGAKARHFLNDEHLDELLMFGVDRKDILVSSIELWEQQDRIDYPFLKLEDYTYFDYLEFHVNDHCNLNCKYCNNFSNLVKEEVFTDFDAFSKDICRLKELVEHIYIIRILGGEPLLNKEVYRYVELIREVYPYSEIRIVTNALLLKQIDEKLIDTMKKNNGVFEVSAYPIMYDKLDSVFEFLEKKGIRYRLGWIANRFRPPIINRYGYPLNTVDCNCIHLRNGYLARCPIVQYLDYYNKANGTSYDGSDGLINIYDENLTFEELWRRINKSFDLCNSCGFWRKDIKGSNWEIDK